MTLCRWLNKMLCFVNSVAMSILEEQEAQGFHVHTGVEGNGLRGAPGLACSATLSV